MMMLLVTFTLQGDQDAFTTALKALGNWSNRIPNAWLLETRLSPKQVRDILGSHMQPGDRLFISELREHWSGRGMGEGFPEWMERRTFRRPNPSA